MAYTVTEVAGPNSVSLDETESVIGMTTRRRSSRAVNEVVEKVMPYMIRPTEKPVIVDSAEKKGESKREKDSQEKTNRAKNVIQCLDMSPLAVCVPDKS